MPTLDAQAHLLCHDASQARRAVGAFRARQDQLFDLLLLALPQDAVAELLLQGTLFSWEAHAVAGFRTRLAQPRASLVPSLRFP